IRSSLVTGAGFDDADPPEQATHSTRAPDSPKSASLIGKFIEQMSRPFGRLGTARYRVVPARPADDPADRGCVRGWGAGPPTPSQFDWVTTKKPPRPTWPRGLSFSDGRGDWI